MSGNPALALVASDQIMGHVPTLKYLMGGDVLEFVKCMQDPGKATGKQNALEFTSGVLSKFAVGVSTRLSPYKVSGMPSNTTRVKNDLVTAFVNARKQMSSALVFPQFQAFAEDGHLYLITNDQEMAGFNVAILTVLITWGQKIKGRAIQRNKNDALRLGCVLLLDKHRAGLQVVLSGKRDREQNDQAGNPAQGFWESIGKDFRDPLVKFDNLSEERMAIIDDTDLNPNDVSTIPATRSVTQHMIQSSNATTYFCLQASRIDIARSWAWMQDTWQNYLRKKLREALKKWNMDTGGGKGVWTNFRTYAKGETSTMLTWVFILDMTKGGLLVSTAGSRTPAGIHYEAGAEKTGGVDPSPPKKSSTQQQISQSLDSLNSMKADTGAALKQIATILQSHTKEGSTKTLTDQIKDINSELMRLNEAETELSNEDLKEIYTPDTKLKAEGGIKRRRLELKSSLKNLFG
jgi:hypothetical protein